MLNQLEPRIEPPGHPDIPTVCHLCWGLWDDGPMPETFRQTADLWEAQGWTVRIWQRAQMMELLHQHPDVLAVCQALPRKVQWADLLRYLIVHEHGGLYSDLDCHPRPGTDLLAFIKESPGHHAFFFVEEQYTEEFVNERCQRHLYVTQGVPEPCIQFGNFLFASIAKNPLILRILQAALDRCRRHPVPVHDFDILHTSGPHILSTVVHSAPAGVSNTIPYRTFARHLCTGTWRNYTLCSACS
jgi:hypothetical protein